MPAEYHKVATWFTKIKDYPPYLMPFDSWKNHGVIYLNILHRINFHIAHFVTAPEFKGKGYAWETLWLRERIIDQSI